MKFEDDYNYLAFLFLGLLQIMLIVEKVTKNITWSWIWILCPTWLFVAVIIILAILFLINDWIESEENKDA